MAEKRINLSNRTVFEAIMLVKENGLEAKDSVASSFDITRHYIPVPEHESCFGRVICIPLVEHIPEGITLILTDGETNQPEPRQDLYGLVYKEKSAGIKWVLAGKIEIPQKEELAPSLPQANEIAI